MHMFPVCFDLGCAACATCACFSFYFCHSDLSCLFIFIAISPLQFGRPVAWPVSLWGQGELACWGAVDNVQVCQHGHRVFFLFPLQ